MIKYFVDYQHLAKGASRPSDDGAAVPIELNGPQDTTLLPNLGDYVDVQNGKTDRPSFSGKVRSRLFTYIRISDTDDVHCLINIIVEDDEDDWGMLIKE